MSFVTPFDVAHLVTTRHRRSEPGKSGLRGSGLGAARWAALQGAESHQMSFTLGHRKTRTGNAHQGYAGLGKLWLRVARSAGE